MLAYVLCKERNADIGFTGLFMKFDEVRMPHPGFMEYAMTGIDTGIDGGFSVIVTLPFFAIEGRTAEDFINSRRIRPGTECNHGAQRRVSLGV
ncbi:MAG: hypothetical protein BWY95_02242 [Bacteroidetes bacterium ADurb.BinA104]|nr:MAG: hypothetical protein BWY95_02242 [Bacteroidetes bacterium ADurb.BinA104]